MTKEYLRSLLPDAPDESESDTEDLARPRHAKLRKQPYTLTTAGVWLSAILLASNCVAFFLAGRLLMTRKAVLDATCAAHTAQWSPVLGDVPIKYQRKSFNGEFMKEDIYRKPGSTEVDEAWEALGVDYRAGVISHEDGIASGLSDSFVQRADKYGGGFLVNVEGMHHLHCLNLLRKALYFNYDRYKDMGHHAFKNEEHILRLHVTHCLDTIRQVLMCNVDTAVLGQVWVDPEKPMAFPDFNTKHVCKNYDAVREWARKLQAPPVNSTPPDYLARPRNGDVLPSIP